MSTELNCLILDHWYASICEWMYFSLTLVMSGSAAQTSIAMLIPKSSCPFLSFENQKGVISIQRCSIENQKGVNAIQRCSIENQKGTTAIDFVGPTAIVPFWFSRADLWIVIAPFWLSTDDMLFLPNVDRAGSTIKMKVNKFWHQKYNFWLKLPKLRLW